MLHLPLPGHFDVSFAQLCVAVCAALVAMLVFYQTRRHFALVRSAAFIERFNSHDYMDARIVVDLHVRKGALSALILDGEYSPDPKIVRERTQVLMFANLFQEMGSSLEKRILDRDYVWKVFGFLAPYYWNQMEEALVTLRRYRERPQLYENFERLARTMQKMDRRHRTKNPEAKVMYPKFPSYLFAYGSMVNPASIRRSLPHVEESTMLLGALCNFQREWSKFIPVRLKDGRIRTAAFLNLRPRPDSYASGVIFPVSEEDLSILDQRERGYERVNVTRHVVDVARPNGTATALPPNARVFTYIAPSEQPDLAHPPEIPQLYLDTVEEGVAHWGGSFAESFWSAPSAPDRFECFSSDYNFLDPNQDKAAGRS